MLSVVAHHVVEVFGSEQDTLGLILKVTCCLHALRRNRDCVGRIFLGAGAAAGKPGNSSAQPPAEARLVAAAARLDQAVRLLEHELAAGRSSDGNSSISTCACLLLV